MPKSQIVSIGSKKKTSLSQMMEVPTAPEPEERGNSNSLHAPSAMPMPSPTEDFQRSRYDEAASLEKQQAIIKIQKYQASPRFSEVLANLDLHFNAKQLERMDREEALDVLNKIRSHLDSHHLDTFYDNLATGGAVAFEKMVDPFYSWKDFSKNLLGNEQFWLYFERYKIEHSFPNVPSHVQLMFIIGSTILMTHQMNVMQAPSVSLIQEQPAPEEKPTEGAPPAPVLGAEL